MFILNIFRPSMPQRQMPGPVRPGQTSQPTIRVLPSFRGGVFHPGFTYNTATDQFISGNQFTFGGCGCNPYGNGYGYNSYGNGYGYNSYGNGYGYNPYGFNGMVNPYGYNAGLPYYYQNRFPQVTIFDYMLRGRNNNFIMGRNGLPVMVDPWMNGPQLQRLLGNLGF
ncbi:MAG: hypothetical protein A3I68_00960 [Candidatus Melainabacteria bacterium RIFCSPLOWO2_02_FULL_35_15]|nr:MAG: hypothetical protein A3F80_09285 [Candidatus Melainabacteria bacterium RIFCSPLOWO2_12_FULL_35_11]OGI13349.1 MAG: hypothetical protein A3I68_00960 [Candidatus Melainabacteria bacterium RIFCSPLOWO2_02_FULL_35_15]